MQYRSIAKVALAASLLITGSGCINHYVARDYDQYLRNNAGTSGLEAVDTNATYALTDRTKNHNARIRSGMAGWGNIWNVEFGEILQSTLEFQDAQTALGLRGDARNKLTFDLVDYGFYNHGAHVTLNVSLSQEDREVFNKTYNAHGITQGGKMFWAGVFGMKNAIHQSTKYAVDEILRNLVSDLKRQQFATTA